MLTHTGAAVALDFAKNEKYAVGNGRFLEAVARAPGMEIFVPSEPDMVRGLGAALITWERSG